MALKVLVVDDQADAIHLLTMLLGMHGFDARGTTYAWGALRTAADWRPDVICVDLSMPGMDGYQLASRMRRIEGIKTARIIAVSGDVANWELLDEAGIDSHVLKPVGLAELRRVISEPMSPYAMAN